MMMMMMVIMVMMVMEAHAPVTCLSYPQPSEACLELMVLCLRCIEAKRCQSVQWLLRQDFNLYA